MPTRHDTISPPEGIKCLVWDLDNTLWNGTLLEGDDLVLRLESQEIITKLDARGILHSIASRNEFSQAWDRVTGFGLASYFLQPQIGWGDKSSAIRKIADALSLSTDSFAFVDDQPFERDEVAFHLPEVRVFDIADLLAAIDTPLFTPRFITDESRRRRQMYQADLERKVAFDQFDGSRDAFLATLDMQVTIRRATRDDLQRAEELTQRTSQLNTTGLVYSQEQLRDLLEASNYRLLVASLSDCYGSSGTIGLILLEAIEEGWVIRLFIMSCRVLTRGIGSTILSRLLASMKARGECLLADYVPTDRNRMIYMTYRFHGFQETSTPAHPDRVRLQHDMKSFPPVPKHTRIIAPDLPV